MAPDSTRHYLPKFFLTGVLVAATLLALLAGWLDRAQILRAAVRAWVVSDSISPADAVAVLAGNVKIRPFAAADLYKKGMAKQVLISSVRSTSGEQANNVPLGGGWQVIRCSGPACDLNRVVLLNLGIPPEAIASFGNEVSNTYEEARALTEWAKANGIRTIIVPTDCFSTRRVRWILNKQLSSVGVRVEVQSLSPLEYAVDNWWQHEDAISSFRIELIKYLYYRLRY
jgi:uncharacterized SAM-binding protein YcdF (DUF218 family)